MLTQSNFGQGGVGDAGIWVPELKVGGPPLHLEDRGVLDQVTQTLIGEDSSLGDVPLVEPAIKLASAGATLQQMNWHKRKLAEVFICRLEEWRKRHPTDFIFKHPLSIFTETQHPGCTDFAKQYKTYVDRVKADVEADHKLRAAAIEALSRGTPGSGGGGGRPSHGASDGGSSLIRAGFKKVDKQLDTIIEEVRSRSISPPEPNETGPVQTRTEKTTTTTTDADGETAAASATTTTTTTTTLVAGVTAKKARLQRQRKKANGTESYKEPMFDLANTTLTQSGTFESWNKKWNLQQWGYGGKSLTLAEWEAPAHGNGSWRTGSNEKVRKLVSEQHGVADWLAYTASVTSMPVASQATLLDQELSLRQKASKEKGERCETIRLFYKRKRDELKEDARFKGFVQGRAASCHAKKCHAKKKKVGE